jgi:putative flavoprotein involved in K+ transport
MEKVEVAIVGAGQAGLALSYRLTEGGLTHVLFEQARIVESWRSKRWDSLRLIAPNWSLIMPGFAYPGPDRDGFMGKDEVVEHLVGYARSFGAPVREGTRATAIEQAGQRTGFVVATDKAPIAARQVVIATGSLQRPNIPDWAADLPPSISQLPALAYRHPGALPPGAVLIVGSGETGCQIAEELARAGRTVYLSCGRSWWAPRRYRGRDIAAWLRSLGWFERTVDDLPPGRRVGQPNPQLTGSDGGHDLNHHSLARDGVRLVGRLEAVQDGRAIAAPDLAANLAWSDEQARTLLRSIDSLIDEQGLDAPAESWPEDAFAPPVEIIPTTSLDLPDAGISSVIYATGYRPDLDWVGLPFLDPDGHPRHRRGVTDVPGLYILGLDWLHTAKSGLFAGIDEDATHLASVIAAVA